MGFDLSPLWISLKSAFAATIIAFFLGIAAARWMIDYRGKGKGLIEGLLISPLVLPPTVVGFLLLLLLGRNGFLGQLLAQMGVTVIFSWSATVIAATVVAFPLMYKTAQGAFSQVDTNLLRAARTLGASELTIFWQVVIPLAYPGIVAGTILTFARALGEFGATLMLAGNIPGQTQTIPVAIYFAVEAGDMQQASIWVLVILAITLTVLIAVSFWSDYPNSFAVGAKREMLASSSVTPNWLPLKSTTDSRGLMVDIQKQLKSFALETSFTAESDTLGLLGASGAGKSMILRCIAGLETPSYGRIVLNGRVLFDSKQGINLPSGVRRIGFLFQNYALFPHLSVSQNIGFGLQQLPKLERARRINAQISLMQLSGLENRYPQQLSGGQQQRVALARALAIQPEAILLDEPFSALDTHLRSQLEKYLIETLSTYQGVSLFVSHNLEEAYRVCKNLLVLSEGKISTYGSKESIFERPHTVGIAQLTGCKNFSRAQVVSPYTLEAADWGCTLRTIEPMPSHLTYVGIRAHQLTFPNDSNHDNTFPCWLVQTSETPHRMTLYLKLHHPSHDRSDYHLQAEVFKEKWAVLKDCPYPWYVCLEP
uniref:molybdate ABC transporter permease subunit n=1 Tax=Nostoc sp. TaxID=1180 RepID=UPI003593590A